MKAVPYSQEMVQTSSVDRKSLNQLLKILVGDRFKEDPAEHLETIRSEKIRVAQSIAPLLQLQKEDRVLEIGAGLGWAGHVFAPQVSQYEAADVSPSFVSLASQELAKFGNAAVRKMSYGDLSPWKDQKINKIFALDVFTQFSFYDHIIYLKEVFHTLTTDGLFYFNFLNVDHLNVLTNSKFLRHSEFYRKDQRQAPLLTHWISPRTLEQFSKNIGFSVLSQSQEDNGSWFLLKKGADS